MKKIIYCCILVLLLVCLVQFGLSFAYDVHKNQKDFQTLQSLAAKLAETQEIVLNRISNLETKNDSIPELNHAVLSDATTPNQQAATNYTSYPTYTTNNTYITNEDITKESDDEPNPLTKVNLANDVFGILPVEMGGTGRTSFLEYSIVLGSPAHGLDSLLPGEAGEILTSHGAGQAPTWEPLPVEDGTFDSLRAGANEAFTVETDGSVFHTYEGNDNAFVIDNQSTNAGSSALFVTGENSSGGTMSITHTRTVGVNDANASALELNLTGNGTSAHGITINADNGTWGNLLQLRSSSADKFVIDASGNVTGSGNITQGAYGTDTNFTKFGNTVGDQFFLGTNGAFRVQRAITNSEAFRVQINGDMQGRWRGTSDGSLQWGDGTNAQDVILRRGSAGNLTLVGGMTINNANNAYNTVIKGANDSNLLYVSASLNAIGIGTSAPKAPLHINKNAAGNAAFIVNQLGSGPILSASRSSNTVFNIDNTGNVRIVASLCVKASINTSCSGAVAGTVYANNTVVQAADMAENYISEQNLEPGDLVMPAGDGNDQAILKTTDPYQSQVIGIISTNPGVTLNSDAETDDKHPHLYPVALQGRVYLKVTASNGTIMPGDLLTTSSTPGVAMKATSKGPIVAKALASHDKSEIGKIMVFVSISYHDGSETVAMQTKPPSKTGVIILPTGATEIEVKTIATADSAHFFVEPEGVPVATAFTRKANDTFVIKTAAPQAQDLKLHWWLVD